MSNNPGYAKGHAEHQHDHQPRKSQHRRDVAAGKIEPECPIQTWNPVTRKWDKEDR